MIAPEVLDVISRAPFVPMLTIGPDGEPHMIVCGRVAAVDEASDTLMFRAVVMRQTRANLRTNPYMQVVLAVRGATPQESKGFRLTGRAAVDGDMIQFRIDRTESLV